MTMRFSIGDTVVVNRPGKPPADDDEHVGKSGVVAETSESFSLVCVRFSDFRRAWFSPAQLAHDGGGDGQTP